MLNRKMGKFKIYSSLKIFLEENNENVTFSAHLKVERARSTIDVISKKCKTNDLKLSYIIFRPR